MEPVTPQRREPTWIPSGRLVTPQRVDWERFKRMFRWEQGEHVLITGPTGTGKTTLETWLAEQRRYVVTLGMKPKDDLFDDMLRRGWQRSSRWPPPEADRQGNRRILLWPVTRSEQNKPKAREVFRKSLRSIFEREGNWTVNVDELSLASDPKWYDLRAELDRIWRQGRSLGISLLTNTQRPSGADSVPPGAYTQITHLFAFQTPDRRDAERVAEIGGTDRRSTQAVLTALPRFDFCYRNTRDDQNLISRCPKRA